MEIPKGMMVQSISNLLYQLAHTYTIIMLSMYCIFPFCEVHFHVILLGRDLVVFFLQKRRNRNFCMELLEPIQNFGQIQINLNHCCDAVHLCLLNRNCYYKVPVLFQSFAVQYFKSLLLVNAMIMEYLEYILFE